MILIIRMRYRRKWVTTYRHHSKINSGKHPPCTMHALNVLSPTQIQNGFQMYSTRQHSDTIHYVDPMVRRALCKWSVNIILYNISLSLPYYCYKHLNIIQSVFTNLSACSQRQHRLMPSVAGRWTGNGSWG